MINDDFDWQTAVLSQYANSPNLLALLKTFEKDLNTDTDINNYHQFIFDVSTAKDYGLDIWARIVGINRTVHFTGASPSEYDTLWGYKGSELQNYDNGNFYDERTRVSANNITMDDNLLRRMILVKAGSNITNGSLKDMTRLISMALPVPFYILNEGYMHIKIYLKEKISFALEAVLKFGNVLPIPAGVDFDIEPAPNPFFGFKGITEAETFNNGTFNS